MERQSSPAVTGAASPSSSSVTSSMTAVTAALTSKTAKPVSTPPADLKKRTDQRSFRGEIKSTECHRDVIKKHPHFKCEVLLFMVIYVCQCLRCVWYCLEDEDALLAFAHQKINTAGVEDAKD